jgi:hypothetical protein
MRRVLPSSAGSRPNARDIEAASSPGTSARCGPGGLHDKAIPGVRRLRDNVVGLDLLKPAMIRVRAPDACVARSTFSLYSPEELRAAIATFLARLPGAEVSWVDQHLLVIADRSRRNQAEPGGSVGLANQAIQDHAHRSASGAPVRLPRGALATAHRSPGYARPT